MPNPPELGGAQSVDRDPRPGEPILRDIAEGIAEQHTIREQADKLRALRDEKGQEVVLESLVFSGAVRELLYAHTDDDHFRGRVMSILERVSLRIPQERNWKLEILGGIQALIADTEGSLAERTAETWQNQRAAKWLGKYVALGIPLNNTGPGAKAAPGARRLTQDIPDMDIAPGMVIVGRLEGISPEDNGTAVLADGVSRYYDPNQFHILRSTGTRLPKPEWEESFESHRASGILDKVTFSPGEGITFVPRLLIRQVDDPNDTTYPLA